jgi:hypothetical protein
MHSLLADQQSASVPNIVYVPVPMMPEQYFALQHAAPMPTLPVVQPQPGEPNVFPHIAAILGNAAKITADRKSKDKGKIIDHAINLFGSVLNLAREVTTKGPLSDTRVRSLAEQFVDQWLSCSIY